jgi:molybdate transport system ATP-binding protein
MLSVALRTRLSASFDLDVSFAAPPGITILFGASGSGKTTVLRAIAGLLRPGGGRVAVGDRTLFDAARRIDVPVARRRVGYVAQQLALFPHLSVLDNVGYGIGHLDRGERARRIGAILSSFGIAHLRARKPADVSGGERQRTALARALVTDPDALLLDEPLSALDYATQTRMLDDLRAWNRERGIPIVYVTHAHREVFALGERVVVLEHGRVRAEGTPHEVLDAPARHTLATQAGFENVFDGMVTSSRPDAGTMTCRIDGLDVEVPYSGADDGDAIRVAVRAGDILVAGEEPRAISARNILPGGVRSLRREGATMIARIAAGPEFEVHLTPAAAQTLALGEGTRVWLVIKTYSWRVMSRDPRSEDRGLHDIGTRPAV